MTHAQPDVCHSIPCIRLHAGSAAEPPQAGSTPHVAPTPQLESAPRSCDLAGNTSAAATLSLAERVRAKSACLANSAEPRVGPAATPHLTAATAHSTLYAQRVSAPPVLVTEAVAQQSTGHAADRLLVPPSTSAPAAAIEPGATAARTPMHAPPAPAIEIEDEVATQPVASVPAPRTRKPRKYKFTPSGKRAVEYALSRPWLDELPLAWRALYQQTCMRYGCRKAPRSFTTAADAGSAEKPIEVDGDTPPDGDMGGAGAADAGAPARALAEEDIPLAARLPAAACSAAATAGPPAYAGNVLHTAGRGAGATSGAADTAVGAARVQDPGAVPARQAYPCALRAAHQAIAACTAWDSVPVRAEDVAAAVESDDPIAALAQAMLPAAVLEQLPAAAFSATAVDAGPASGACGVAVPQAAGAAAHAAEVPFVRVRLKSDEGGTAAADTAAAASLGVCGGGTPGAAGGSGEPRGTDAGAAPVAVQHAEVAGRQPAHQMHEPVGAGLASVGPPTSSGPGAGAEIAAAQQMHEEHAGAARAPNAACVGSRTLPDDAAEARSAPLDAEHILPSAEAAVALPSGGSGGVTPATPTAPQPQQPVSAVAHPQATAEPMRQACSAEPAAAPKRMGLMRVGVKRRQMEDEEEDDAPLRSRKATARPQAETGAWRRAWAQRLRTAPAATDTTGAPATISPPTASPPGTDAVPHPGSPAASDTPPAIADAAGTVMEPDVQACPGSGARGGALCAVDSLRPPTPSTGAAPAQSAPVRGSHSGPERCSSPPPEAADQQHSTAAAHATQQRGRVAHDSCSMQAPEGCTPVQVSRLSGAGPGIDAVLSPLPHPPYTRVVPETCMPSSGVPCAADAPAGVQPAVVSHDPPDLAPNRSAAAAYTPMHVATAHCVPVMPSTIGDVIPETCEIECLPVGLDSEAPGEERGYLGPDVRMHEPHAHCSEAPAAMPEPSPCMAAAAPPNACSPTLKAAHPSMGSHSMHGPHGSTKLPACPPTFGAQGFAVGRGSPCSPALQEVVAGGSFPGVMGSDCIPDTPDDGDGSPTQPTPAPCAQPLFAAPTPVTFRAAPTQPLAAAPVQRLSESGAAAPARSVPDPARPCRVPDIFAMSPVQPTAAAPLDYPGPTVAPDHAGLELGIGSARPEVPASVSACPDSPLCAPVARVALGAGIAGLCSRVTPARPSGLSMQQPACALPSHIARNGAAANAGGAVVPELGLAAPLAAPGGRSSTSTDDVAHGGTPVVTSAPAHAAVHGSDVKPWCAATLRRRRVTRSSDGKGHPSAAGGGGDGGGDAIDMTLDDSPDQSPLLAAGLLTAPGKVTQEHELVKQREMLHDSSDDELGHGEAPRARGRPRPKRQCLDDSDSDRGEEAAVEDLTGTCTGSGTSSLLLSTHRSPSLRLFFPTCKHAPACWPA